MKTRMLAGAAAALCCAGLAWGQSANDLCANATPVTVDTPVNGAVAAADTNDSPTTTVTTNGCSASFLGTTRKSVYYSFVPATSGNYEFSLCAATGTTLSDTRMAIWAATDTTPGSVAPCSGTVPALACNDDSCGLRSNFNVNLSAGAGYIVQVAPFSTSATAAGTFILLVHGPQSTPAPANDDCSGATALTSGSPTAGDLTNATGSSTTLSTCGSSSTTGNDVWYSITSGVGGGGSVDVCGNFDTIVSVYTAASTCASPSSLICNDDTIPAGCTLHGSRATWTATSGSTYLIRVAGVRGTGTADTTNPFLPAQGTFTITATITPQGACCNGTSCTVVASGTCAFVYQGDGTTCSPNVCQGACCVGTACSLAIGAGACAGVFRGAGSVCSPTPCSDGSVSNDECAAAIVISSATLPATADGNNATASTDPMPAVCATSSRDAWYTFTPTISQNYSVRTCGGQTGTLDTVLSVHTACPTPTANNLLAGGCNDDGCSGVGASQISSIMLNAGTTYWIRVARYGTSSAGGPFTVTIDEITGSCCNPTSGACSITTQAACGAGAWTFGVTCTSSTCGGACCNDSTGACATLGSTSGCDAGTSYQGAGSTCSPNPCPQFSGACCATDGTCSIASPTACASPNVYLGNNSTCNSAIGCPATGACCAASGSCTVTFEANCTGTSQWTSGGVCDPSPCVVGACCNGTSCSVVTDFACAGDYLGDNVACDTSTCALGACCLPSTGTCIQTNETLCLSQGGTFNGVGTFCNNVAVGGTLFSSGDTFPISIPDASAPGVSATIVIPSGSGTVSGLSVSIGLTHTWVGDLIVTLSNGSTTVTLLNRVGGGSDLGGVYTFSDSAQTTFISAAGGASVAPGIYRPGAALSAFDGAPYEGTWTLTVSDNAGADTGTIDALSFVSLQITPNCQFTGACCCGSTCSATLAADCTGVNQTFIGAGTVCNASGNIDTPCCLADYNHAGGVTVQDIFDFLAGYFSGNTCADINGGGVTVQDIFDYLAAYFTGCT